MSNSPSFYSPHARVFISSVIDGFQEYREIARQAIKKVGGEPVLVNEDFPALSTSPRNACLDAVDSCDLYVAIIGKRGGWETPSGKLVVEEEYLRAKERKLPTFIFLQSVDRDAEGQRLAALLEDYVDGALRISFQTREELGSAIERTIKTHLLLAEKPKMDKEQIRRVLDDSFSIPQEASLRFVLTPERQEEVIDPVQLSSSEFIDQIYELGHSKQVKLFSYQEGKRATIQGGTLIIDQLDTSRGRDVVEAVRLKLTESGLLSVDTNVTRRVHRGASHSMLDSTVVAIEDIEEVLNKDFRFVATFFNHIDQYKRHQRFYYNVALLNLGHRKLERNPKERNFYSTSSNNDKMIPVFSEVRLVSREDLQASEHEMKRIITVLSQKMSSSF